MSVNSFISTSTMKRRVGVFAKKYDLDKETLSKEIEIPSWMKCVYGINPAMPKGTYYPDVNILAFDSIAGGSARLANVSFVMPDTEYFQSLLFKDVDWDGAWEEICAYYDAGITVHWSDTDTCKKQHLRNLTEPKETATSKYALWLKDFEVRTESDKLTVAVSACHQPIIKGFIERYARELKVKEDNNVN